MECYAGFDMQSFLATVKEQYGNNNQVHIQANYIEFDSDIHLRLPFEGHKLLRFSSKSSNTDVEGAGDYVKAVIDIARIFFGSRIRTWNDAVKEGFYSCKEVDTSFQSYEQPGDLEIPSSTAQDATDTDFPHERGMLYSVVEKIPGEGRGLVARCNIPKGTRILLEKPLFTVDGSTPISELESNIGTKLKLLSKSEQREFLNLQNNFPGKHPFGGTFRTNGRPCGPGSSVAAVYLTICLIDHDCVPNAQHSWNNNLQGETIHAGRHINTGEEITITYDDGKPYELRQKFLKEQFGFDCRCGLCSGSDAELQMSDTRRRRIEQLDEGLFNLERTISRPHEALAHCEQLLQILQEEYNGDATTLIARLYYDALQISARHGDEARTSIFAERGYNVRVLCLGEDHPTTQEMKKLMKNPKDYKQFGLFKQPGALKEPIPNDLDKSAFEKWLWMSGK